MAQPTTAVAVSDTVRKMLSTRLMGVPQIRQSALAEATSYPIRLLTAIVTAAPIKTALAVECVRVRFTLPT